jgi:hypothetical protein
MEDLTQPHADTEVPNETTRTNEAPLAPAHGSAVRKCPECGRETRQVIECLICQEERIELAAPKLLAAAKAVLASGYPTEKEHPLMFAAFRQLADAVNDATPPNAASETRRT